MFKITLPITEENKKLGITPKEQNDLGLLAEKLLEEADEVICTVPLSEEEDLLDLTCEVVDVLQIATVMLKAIENKQPGMVKKAEYKHIEKIFNRGWKYRNIVKISEE